MAGLARGQNVDGMKLKSSILLHEHTDTDFFLLAAYIKVLV